MPDDTLTAFLDMVTSDASQESMTHDAEDCADWRNSCAAHNAERLAGMVRGVLELAAEWDAESDELDDRADAKGTDEEAAPILRGEAIAYHDCASALREAISREITGKGEQ